MLHQNLVCAYFAVMQPKFTIRFFLAARAKPVVPESYNSTAMISQLLNGKFELQRRPTG